MTIRVQGFVGFRVRVDRVLGFRDLKFGVLGGGGGGWLSKIRVCFLGSQTMVAHEE